MTETIDTKLALLQDAIEKMLHEIADIKLAVVGDSNGTKGLVRRMDDVMACINFRNPLSAAQRLEKLETWQALVTAITVRFLLPLLIIETATIITFVGGLLTHTISLVTP